MSDIKSSKYAVITKPTKQKMKKKLLSSQVPSGRKGNVARINWSLHTRNTLLRNSTNQKFCNLQETVPAYKFNLRWNIGIDSKIGEDDKGNLIG